ncbi:Fic family protein [Pasteurella skyensis]|uniref:Fic family protein n=1 Tax=Phocoenobacter skyensis TaxID=97481 RepID=UPI00278CA869|nr:Fic family protein [Pasteurella skyensis]MDP8170598.1 Fic family protein [Pasteurella skyensis]
MHNIITHLKKLKNFLNARRPLPQSVLKKLFESLKQEYIYHSNAIEGNSLTLRETQIVLEQGITINGKPLKDHIETQNQSYAIDYLLEEIALNRVLDIRLIKEFHQIVIGSIDREIAGVFRNHDVVISHSKTETSRPFHIEEDLQTLLDWYNQSDRHIIEKVAIFHARFEKIHPFSDGNGRTGRLLMNLELMKQGYPITIIKNEDREKYYQVLENAQTSDNYQDVIDFVANNVQASIERNLEMLDRDWKIAFNNQELTP